MSNPYKVRLAQLVTRDIKTVESDSERKLDKAHQIEFFQKVQNISGFFGFKRVIILLKNVNILLI